MIIRIYRPFRVCLNIAKCESGVTFPFARSYNLRPIKHISTELRKKLRHLKALKVRRVPAS